MPVKHSLVFIISISYTQTNITIMLLEQPDIGEKNEYENILRIWYDCFKSVFCCSG